MMMSNKSCYFQWVTALSRKRYLQKVNDIKTTVKQRFWKAWSQWSVASFKSEIPTFWFHEALEKYQSCGSDIPCVRNDHFITTLNHVIYGYRETDLVWWSRIGWGLIASMLYSIWPTTWTAESIEIDYVNWVAEGGSHIKVVWFLPYWRGMVLDCQASKPMRSYWWN